MHRMEKKARDYFIQIACVVCMQSAPAVINDAIGSADGEKLATPFIKRLSMMSCVSFLLPLALLSSFPFLLSSPPFASFLSVSVSLFASSCHSLHPPTRSKASVSHSFHTHLLSFRTSTLSARKCNYSVNDEHLALSLFSLSLPFSLSLSLTFIYSYLQEARVIVF